MAEALVGGAFLSAFLQVLFDRLASPELKSFFTKQKFDDGLIDKLKVTLMALQAVLDDAEDKQISDKHVKAWLDELQHVVYHADDLLDEIATKALKNKLEADGDQSQTQKVSLSRFFHLMKQFLLRINCLVSAPPYLSDEAMESRMKEVISELEGFVNQKNSLRLIENIGRRQSRRLQTTSLVDESEVYGRDNEKEKMMKLLLSRNATKNEILVIPIVGMGGVGKTTLTQLVYNDVRVDQNFDMKAWVSVPDEFDVYVITKKILEAVIPSTNVDDNLGQLQIKLKESLAGKNFLIVLDDVWNDDYIAWDLLKKPLMAGAHGSTIIITTRMDKVALAMSTVPSYFHLKELSSEDCWSLFAKHAFVNGDYKSHPNLEKIGREIVKKCKGLPLAVKSLGGMLRSKQDIGEWKYILKSEIWGLKESKILPALRLSYQDLPSPLKRCFAYCSTFPKNYRFGKERSVQLWIALDLVQNENNMSLEDTGNHYFYELLSRSFFHSLSDNSDYFAMHDLIRDLAQHISGEFYFILDDDKAHNISKKVRHLSYPIEEFELFEKFKIVNEAKYLRSIIGFTKGEPYFFLSNKVVNDVLPNLRCLRALSLARYQISELPQSIENLIHLRYLNLSWTKIKQLPESITTLCNLDTLDLSYCKDFIELPVNMGKLINLRHLDIRETGLTEMPMQMSRLKDLQHLTDFVVGKDGGSRISGLKELCQLRGQLFISGLENVTSGLDASDANLTGKEHLEVLGLKWGGHTNDPQKEREVLDQLQPHAGVKKLIIFNYGGTRFPDWLERSHSFCNMANLELMRCGNCYFLPSIGQLPSLKYLRIEGMKEIREVSREFYGDSVAASSSSMKPFPSLEILSFDEMPEWEEWHALGAGEFSCLLELSLVNSPKLKGELPNHLPCLRKLTISGCQQLLSDQVALLLPCLPSLQKLEISGMANLKELPPELCKLLNLESLVIKGCRSLESVLEMGLPPTLKILKIERCEALKSLTLESSSSSPPPPEEEGMNMNSNTMMRINNICLQELCISECSSLLQLRFPIGGLPPPTLKTLRISDCRCLGFPLLFLSEEVEETEEHDNHTTCSIEVLNISGFDLLKSLSLGFFPKLRSLHIKGCINFETLSIPDNEELQNLTDLRIFDCPKMTSFWVYDCKKLKSHLKSQPQRMHTLLPSLQILIISNCPEVESFPEGGLPSNLTTLGIRNCEKLMKGRMGWRLQQTLPSLQIFFIGGEYEEELESFPEEWLLPTTLTSLHISKLPNLKSLNHKGLQHLNSLQSLNILECPKLQCLPEEGLPNSLCHLIIDNCPLLKARCQREKVEDWSNISRIRHIRIDGEDIVNLE